ncbi:hypothetical protein VINE108274_04325 [Vibrio neptunius]
MTKITAQLEICAVFGRLFFVLLVLFIAAISTIFRIDEYLAPYIDGYSTS